MTEKKTPIIKDQNSSESQNQTASTTKNPVKAAHSDTPERQVNSKKTSSEKTAPPSRTAQRDTTKQKRQSTHVTTSNSKTSILAFTLSLIAIAGIGGHYYWQTEQHKALISDLLAQNKMLQTASEQQVLNKVTQLQHQLAGELTTNVTRLINDNDDKVQSLTQKIEALSQNQPSDWLLHEAEYLIRIASRSLWFEKNTNTAIGLLHDADTRLKELNDPSLLPVRQLINQDIEQLKLQPTLATDETMLTLMAMAEQIKNLPIAMAHLPDNVEPEQKFELSENTNDWQDNLTKSWQKFLKSFITVKRRTANVEALLTPQQQQNLIDNLSLKLQLAQWAVSQQKQTLYKRSLTDAQQWVLEYFDTDSSATMQFIEQLNQLQGAVISLTLPEELRSLKSIRQTISRSKQSPITTVELKRAEQQSMSDDTAVTNKPKQDTQPSTLKPPVKESDVPESSQEEDNNGAML